MTYVFVLQSKHMKKDSYIYRFQQIFPNKTYDQKQNQLSSNKMEMT